MRRIRYWVLALLSVVGSIVSWWFIFHAGGSRPLYTISKETTHVTGPVDEEGYVNYAAALNDRLSEGITPANNANMLIVKAAGPAPRGVKMPTEFYARLGMSEPPAQGDYFIGLSEYLDRQLKIVTEADHKAKMVIVDELQQLAASPWKAADHPYVHSWLMLNEMPLAVAMDASKRRHYYLPLIPKSDNGKRCAIMTSPMPTIQIYHHMAVALLARAMHRLDEGHWEEAWQDLLAAHRLGRISSRGATLIEELVGVVIEKTAVKADIAFLAHSGIDAGQIRACLTELKTLAPLGSTADKLDVGERFSILDAVMFLDQGALDTSATSGRVTGQVDWDPALLQINSYFDRLTSACRLKDHNARKKLLGQMDRELKEMMQRWKNVGWLEKPFMTRYARGQYMGDVATSLLVPAFNKMIEAEECAEQMQRNLYVAFGLAGYQRDHGRYPLTLPELVPRYLDSLPDDLYTNQPLIYRTTEKGYLLYSVGSNGQDDGGERVEGRSGADDISVHMPPQLP